MVTSAALAVGLAQPAAATTTATSTEPATSSTASSGPVAVAADVAAASQLAREQGSRVEAASERTEFFSTFVNPDGTLTTELHAGPTRFRNAAGQWQDVDLTMVELPGGGVGPKGHPLGLRLPGAAVPVDVAVAGGVRGGVDVDVPSPADPPAAAVETDFATAGDAQGRSVTWAFPGQLPPPVLKETTATYPQVTPGVDLVVESRRSGFEQFFVLTAPPGPGVVSWSLPIKTKGLTPRAEDDSSISFLDAKARSCRSSRRRWRGTPRSMTGLGTR